MSHVGSATSATDEGLRWQVGVWDRMSDLYKREIDARFASVVEGVLARARLAPGERVLDLGTGTGAVAWGASSLVGPGGSVVGVDISPQMLKVAEATALRIGARNVALREGRAESIPAEPASFDAALASLSLMYVLDRGAGAREIARVLRPGGRFVAAVWAGADLCDIVKFQQTAGKFAPKPPVPGVGPGALADPSEFLGQLREAGVDARVETEDLGFEFPDFESAWEVLAGVTTAGLAPDAIAQAKRAVQDAMWPDARSERRFRNATHFIVGMRR